MAQFCLVRRSRRSNLPNTVRELLDAGVTRSFGEHVAEAFVDERLSSLTTHPRKISRRTCIQRPLQDLCVPKTSSELMM
jgi:hypothetical protein